LDQKSVVENDETLDMQVTQKKREKSSLSSSSSRRRLRVMREECIHR